METALQRAVSAGEADLVDLRIDQRSFLRGFLAGQLQFRDGSQLHFREFVDLEAPSPRLMYAYHYQDAGGHLRRALEGRRCFIAFEGT